MKRLKLSIPSYTQLLNDRIGGDIKDNYSSQCKVEERLYKESLRFLSTYKTYRKRGSSCRKNYLLCTTSMMLFRGEVRTISSAQASATVQASNVTQAETQAQSSRITISGSTLYDTLHSRQQQTHKATLCNEFLSFSHNLNLIGLELEKVQLRRLITNKVMMIDIHQCRTAKRHYHPDERDGDTTVDQIPYIARLMLQYGVSYECCHELTQVVKQLPRSHKVKKYRNSLPVPEISKTPGQFEGAKFCFKKVLELRLEEEVRTHAKYYTEHNQHVKIRISGDGARYSRTSSYCLLSFGFLREHDCSLSPADLCILAVIKGSEDYKHLAIGFKDSFNELNEMIANPALTFEGIRYTLEFFLSADYKFLLTLMGMKNATCQFSCIWCTINRDDRYDMSIDIPNEDVKFRQLNDFKADSSFSNDKLPLLNIPLDHIVPDELHLLLRVTDVLIEALITTAIAHDRHNHHEQVETRPRRRVKAYKMLEGNMLNELVKVMNDCQVQFKLWLDKEKEKDKEKLHWTSLMGPNKLKLLKKLPNKLNETCQPKDMVQDIKDLWEKFEVIYGNISSPRPSLSGDELKQKGKDWVKLFLEIGEYPFSDGYQPNEISPYIHTMVYHFSYFVKKYDNVKQFSCQGVEKKNDQAKKGYFKNSNRWDSSADILRHDYQLWLLKNRKRKIGNYSKGFAFWYDDGIQESRNKRLRAILPHQL